MNVGAMYDKPRFHRKGNHFWILDRLWDALLTMNDTGKWAHERKEITAIPVWLRVKLGIGKPILSSSSPVISFAVTAYDTTAQLRVTANRCDISSSGTWDDDEEEGPSPLNVRIVKKEERKYNTLLAQQLRRVFLYSLQEHCNQEWTTDNNRENVRRSRALLRLVFFFFRSHHRLEK